MKQLVKIARSVTIQNKVEVELDIPQESMFYKRMEDWGIESIFAIIPKVYKLQAFKDLPVQKFFRLIKVELYEQQFEDLSLGDFWTVDFAKYNPLRAIALDIFEDISEFEPISKEEWIEQRNEFLNIDKFLTIT
jgi:hypothetical protein